jgi:deoxyadenosine/deoxycytidine kinase
VHVIPENVDKWNEVCFEGKTILELFYQDMDKWRSKLECTILKDRFKIIRDQATAIKNNNLLIIERSAESSKEVFV